MKLGMSHYGHKSIPDAKFESGSSSSFGGITSQIFSRKKRMESSNLGIYLLKMGLTLKKNEFLCPESFFLTQKLIPNVNFSNFQEEDFFLFSNLLGRLDEKRAAAAPLIDQFC